MGPENFINKFPGDAGAVSPGTTLGTIAVRSAGKGREDISGPPFQEVTTKKRCDLFQVLLRLPSYALSSLNSISILSIRHPGPSSDKSLKLLHT